MSVPTSLNFEDTVWFLGVLLKEDRHPSIYLL